MSEKFAKEFNSEQWAHLAGLWHDLGKYRPAFQAHIKKASGYDLEAHISSEDHPNTSHASTGAVYAESKLRQPYGIILAYLIAGHHAGLPDFSGDNGRVLQDIFNKDKALLKEALAQKIPEDILAGDCPQTLPLGRPEEFHLWIRMLFSCLVEADFLDTESFMSQNKKETRAQGFPPLSKLLSYFNQHMGLMQKKAQLTVVNQMRVEILDICRKKAMGTSGIYTMTVPTGGGKTLSSLAFALEHAIHHKKSRIIYAIPYTSIIEQTANIFRKIFEPLGENVIIEHHSNMEPKKQKEENSWSRLATENWDAPLIVTTTVQLFESLYAARTSRCRKLHNLINSIIVLDEIQLLPPDQLNPIRHVIKILSKHYGVTFVMSTATPTGLRTHANPFGKILLEGLSSKEIIDTPEQYYAQLQRVKYSIPEDLNQPQSWDTIAEELRVHESVLVVVNTRKDAKELWEKMPHGTYHLSALMCAEHRSQKIEEIKQRLFNKELTRVISTQLVEAGVDFDFPVVYRALAGLDSIVQAAGRCNREGKLEQGTVVIFVPPSKIPAGLLSTAAHTSISVLTGFTGNIESPATFEYYFQQFFASVKEHDRGKVLESLHETADEGKIQFRTAAQKFHMIEDKDMISVFVRFGKSDSLIGLLKAQGPQRWLLRALQRYTVNIYPHQFAAMLQRGELEKIWEGFYAQSGSGIYHEDTGLLIDIPELSAHNSVY